MTTVPLKENELERILRLAEYDFDYSSNQDNLDNLTKLAAHIAGTPISQLNLIGPNNQWSISNYGIEEKQIARDRSVCQYTINELNFFEVTDLSKDDRFMNMKCVKEAPHVRYYFGIPLETPDGYNIGALCVMDQKEHSFTPSQIEMLQTISIEIISVLEQKKINRELQLNLDEASEKVSKVSHDIRGPISGIIGLADIIKIEANKINADRIAELVDLLGKSGKSIIDLADEILNNEKYNAIKLVPSTDRITMLELKQKLLDLYAPQALAKNIELKVKADLHNRDLYFSKSKLLQILGNLISNALKFTPNKGSVLVSIKLDGLGQTKKLCVTVVDSGIGMNKSQINGMLSGDNKKSHNGTNNERGFGFGFQLARHLIKSLNGELDISSQEGVGTTITVKLLVKGFFN